MSDAPTPRRPDAPTPRRPDAVLANQKMGDHYFAQKDYPLALQHFSASIDSSSELFRMQPRVTSALYMAEILCMGGSADSAIGVLAQIPNFGGDINAVENLLPSLRFSGYNTCYKEISRWYESRE
ncbi:MAG: hypothetical protein ACI9JM_002559 [Halioglobus sp.]|jgi:hypothetical protein